jgi:hypothetical protein
MMPQISRVVPTSQSAFLFVAQSTPATRSGNFTLARSPLHARRKRDCRTLVTPPAKEFLLRQMSTRSRACGGLTLRTSGAMEVAPEVSNFPAFTASVAISPVYADAVDAPSPARLRYLSSDRLEGRCGLTQDVALVRLARGKYRGRMPGRVRLSADRVSADSAAPDCPKKVSEWQDLGRCGKHPFAIEQPTGRCSVSPACGSNPSNRRNTGRVLHNHHTGGSVHGGDSQCQEPARAADPTSWGLGGMADRRFSTHAGVY